MSLMTKRLALSFLLTCALTTGSSGVVAQSGGTAPLPERAIRRDVPMTNAIRRAFDAGTRDRTGRPGPELLAARRPTTRSTRASTRRRRRSPAPRRSSLHNNSPQPLTEIVLRLDQNIFRGHVPRGSLGAGREHRRHGRHEHRRQRRGGRSERRRRGGAADAAAVARRGAAAARRASGLDQTLARISLATPIAAKATATLEIDWHTKLPGGPGRGHRMTQRWDDTLFQPTQWYPRVAVYDDLRGWDTNLYLGPSEFYNNFGRFDVSIDVPGGWIVSGTGVLQNPQEVLTADGARAPVARARVRRRHHDRRAPTKSGPARRPRRAIGSSWHFVADTVNDFAWATAKKFVWKATRATIPGKGAGAGPHGVSSRSTPRSYANAGPIARHALEFYSKLWMPYPFPQLTLQDGPSAGMEYPMVINSNQGAADHETGHQWWPMMVSNNETWYGWMDEGFNQYMNILSGADARRDGAEPRTASARATAARAATKTSRR